MIKRKSTGFYDMNTYECKAGFPVIKLGRSLTLNEINSLSEYVDILFRDSPSALALDFSSIETIDSGGISFLVKVSRLAREKEIELIFSGINDSLHRLFSVGGLDMFFNIMSEAEFNKKYNI